MSGKRGKMQVVYKERTCDGLSPKQLKVNFICRVKTQENCVKNSLSVAFSSMRIFLRRVAQCGQNT